MSLHNNHNERFPFTGIFGLTLPVRVKFRKYFRLCQLHVNNHYLYTAAMEVHELFTKVVVKVASAEKHKQICKRCAPVAILYINP